MPSKKKTGKSDLNAVFEKYQPVIKKLGQDLGVAAKKGEEGIVTMSKILKIQMDILGGSLQREKLYYEIGKKVADKLINGDLKIEGFEKYRSKLEKIQSDEAKKKTEMSKVKKTGKKKKK